MDGVQGCLSEHAGAGFQVLVILVDAKAEKDAITAERNRSTRPNR